MASKLPQDDNTPKPAEDANASSEEDRSVVDRRAGLDRRQKPAAETGYAGSERRSGTDRAGRRTGLERRRGAGIRRPEERKAAEEGEMTIEQFEFVMAIETYKKVNKKMFPTWTEVLEVIQQLGYRKIEHRSIDLQSVPEPTLHRKAA
jgi:hypothetical protein